MNYRMVAYIIGQILKIEAALLVLPLLVSLIYKENRVGAFLLPILLLLVIGTTATWQKPANKKIYAKEGFVIVSGAWIFMSLFGCLPFFIDGCIPSFADCFFETVSGFTTTGASILTNVEALPLSMLFWRSFTHWIGGMGVLVFVLAILPQTDTQSMYLMKAEVPGPTVGKLVSKIKLTARILYGIYIVLTLIEIVLLKLGGMAFFDCVVNSFGTAGTGGFSIKNSGIAFYQSSYIEYVIGIFMIIFGINFNLFYLIIIGKIRQAVKSEELRGYLLIVLVAVALITLNIYPSSQSLEQAFRHAFFQVSSIITTTGYSTADFVHWPLFSQGILLLLMFFGGCAGSTSGGIKISRIVILFKTVIYEIKRMISPKAVVSLKLEGKTPASDTLRGVYCYFIAYMLTMGASVLLITLENMDFTTVSTAVISCINNVGPGLGAVGPMGNFSAFSDFSKYLLSFDMLAGRLEIFPMLIIFSPAVWKRKK